MEREPWDLLRTFEISVNDLLRVKVVHSSRYLTGPIIQPLGRHFFPIFEQIVERPVGAVLHHDAVAGGLRADTSVEREMGDHEVKTDVGPNY